ncbi:MAG TPA: glycosyltransferase [Armatimonadota bacterium]
MNITQELSQCVEQRLLLEGRSPCAPAQEFHIGFGIDAAFVRPLGVLITSLCENNPQLALSCHVMTIALNEEEISQLRAIAAGYRVNIHIYFLNLAFFAGLPTKRDLPIPTYFRFVLPTLVEAQTVLYLDSDIICINSVQPLFEASLGEHVLAAVPDAERTATRRMAALHLSTYFNAGVLLINIANWRREQVSRHALSLLFEMPNQLTYLDQDALNIVLEGKTTVLDNKWNYFVSEQTNEAVIHQACLLHFAAHPKPWTVAFGNTPIQQRYLDYEQRSPWAGVPLQQPRTFHAMRLYAEKLWQKRNYRESIAWYLRYVHRKFIRHE